MTNVTRRQFIKKSTLASGVLTALPFAITSNPLKDEIRIGIIGLDTSHSPAFAKLFNAANPMAGLTDFKVVAAYPQGSADIQSSVERIPAHTKEIQQYGVEIVDSIKKLLQKVDVVLLETNDGRPHLEQFREVAQAKNVPVFSSSSLRYMKNVQAVRNENKIGRVLGADTFSPATLEPHHPDLFWYGIHGVEVLFAVMGTGCETVTRFYTEETDVVVGKWKDGRLGTFRGTRSGKHDYGGTGYGTEGDIGLGPFDGYEALAVKIADFFRTKVSPVDARETIEIYAFMEAADESKRRGGVMVSIDEVLKKARG